MIDRHVIVIVTVYPPPPPVSVITRDGVYYCDRYIIFCAVTYDITVLNENNTICNTSIGMMRDRRHVLYLYRVIPQTCTVLASVFVLYYNKFIKILIFWILKWIQIPYFKILDIYVYYSRGACPLVKFCFLNENTPPPPPPTWIFYRVTIFVNVDVAISWFSL